METSARGLVVYQDGKIVVAGQAWAGPGTGRFVLARCHANGDLDTTFGTHAGRTVIHFGPGTDAVAGAFRQDADGKLVMTGSAYTSTGARPVLARCHENGQLDTAFASGGKTLPGTIPGPPNRMVRALAIDTSGGLVTAGFAGPFPMVCRSR